jgi:protein O-mannosyl-transferase
MYPKNKSKKKQPEKNKQTSKAPKTNQFNWVWLALGVVLITTLFIYFQALKFDLLDWDDNLYLVSVRQIKHLNWESIKLFFTNYYLGNYHPFTMLFYAVEQTIGRGQSSVYHLNNIILHIINTVLVFVLIRKISPKNAIVALITAAFFAVHPMHVESVAWVAERKDVLYSFFFLLSLIIYLNYLNTKKLQHLIIAGIFFLFSCLSKSAAVVLPVVLVLLDYYTGRKFNWKTLAEKLPFFVISLIFGIIAVYSQNVKGQAPELKISVLERISVVSYSFVSYLLRLFVPIKLSAIYPYPMELNKTLPVFYYTSVLGVALLIIFIWFSRKWGKDILFGFLFFVITIVLVLQFVPVGNATMADRYTYIPYIGIFFIIGKLYERLLQGKFKKAMNKYSIAAFFIVFAVFSSMAYTRIKIWKNNDILLTDVIQKYPNSIAYYNRALSRGKYKNYPGAISDYDMAIGLNNNYTAAYYSRGVIKCYQNDYSGALPDFNKAIELDSNYTDAYSDRGNVKYMLKDFKGALADYNKALEINPNDKITIKNRDLIMKSNQKSPVK